MTFHTPSLQFPSVAQRQPDVPFRVTINHRTQNPSLCQITPCQEETRGAVEQSRPRAPRSDVERNVSKKRRKHRVDGSLDMGGSVASPTHKKCMITMYRNIYM